MHIREEILKGSRQLEIRSRRHLSALLAGNYRSAFRGSGMQFKEFRPYEPGDDIRHMSWNVTARTGKPTIKLYEEERELNIILVVDVSGSSLLGVKNTRKIDMYAELVALLGLSAIRSQDNVGFMFFNDSVVQYLPPRRTRSYVLNGMAQVLSQPMDGSKSELGAPLKYLSHVLGARSIVVIISDFLVPDFSRDLRMLAMHHEAILLHCYDDRERGFGVEEGIYEIRDPETHELLLLDTGSKKSRDRLNQIFVHRSSTLESLAQATRSDYLMLSLEDNYVQRLVHFFRERGPSRL